jgi:hypothetical protein
VQPEPEEVLDRRSQKIHNRVVVELLVRWIGLGCEEASWEPYHRLQSTYPHLVGRCFE